MKLGVTVPALFVTLTFASIGNAHAQANIGTLWNEQELGWQGVWTRVGTSDRFQAVWTLGARVVRANLQVIVKGNDVIVWREDTAGPGVGRGGCKYTGKISGRSVSGKYSCTWAKRLIPWKATISQ